jgi:hypothetical protein
VFVLNLTVNPVYAFNENYSMCDGDVYTWHGNTYSSGGVYYDSLQTLTGCDSTFTLNLTVNPLPEVFLGNDTTICADAFMVLDAGNPGATYLWSEGGATGQSIMVDSTSHGAGTFDVSVTVNNGCIASDTIAITIEICDAIDEHADMVFHVFPNPGNGLIYIYSNGSADAEVELTNAQGQLLFKGKYNQLNGPQYMKEFDLGVYAPGVYFLRMENEVIRIVRE